MFKKYPSIENHYHNKFINHFKSLYPELENSPYIILEKIHGTNFSLVFNGSNVSIGKRSKILPMNEKFFGLQDYIHGGKFDELIRKFIRLSSNNPIQLYGEYFGPGINKGVNYGKEKQIRFFDVRINSLMMPHNHFVEMMFNLGFNDLVVPQLDIVESLEDALNFNPEINSKFTVDDSVNLIEGIVIKPYNKVFISPVGEYFMLKKKNEKFMEKQRQKEPKKENTVIDNLNNQFLDYVTENRLINIFSQHGEIQGKKEIGKYIRLLIEDAKKDFLKEVDLPVLDKNETKQVFNAGSKPFQLLQKYL